MIGRSFRRRASSVGLGSADKLSGRAEEIFAERDRKLEAAREERKQRRQASRGACAGSLDGLALAAVN